MAGGGRHRIAERPHQPIAQQARTHGGHGVIEDPGEGTLLSPRNVAYHFEVADGASVQHQHTEYNILDTLANMTGDAGQDYFSDGMTEALITELHAAFTSLSAADDIRAVVLAGAGRSFCAGADLTDPESFPAAGQSMGQLMAARLREYYNPAALMWCNLPVPLVVGLNGVSAGAGASLALTGDITVAAQSASLTQTEIQIANCIMQGMRSKEIAGLMKLSKGTIDFYRNNIRKKLGIRNQKANLQSYLLAHFKM